MVGFESVVKRVGRMDFDSGGDGSNEEVWVGWAECE